MPTRGDLFIDTAGWGYFLDSKDPLQPVVEDIMKRAVIHRRKLVTTNYIITELVVLLSNRYHQPRQQVIKAINAIKTDPTVEVVHIDLATDGEAWALLEARPDKGWSLVDASSFVVMQRFGMTEAITTDHHFDQAGLIKLLQFDAK